MKIVVLKFGGTSVGSLDRIKKVAKIIATYKRKKLNVIIVSSAMSGTTNDLINKSKQESLLKLAEEEANKADVNDQSKYLIDQKIEVLRSIN